MPIQSAKFARMRASRLREDIQVLRGITVITVILFHFDDIYFQSVT